MHKLLFALCGAFMGLSCQPPSLILNAVIGTLSALIFSIAIARMPLTLGAGFCFGIGLTVVQFHWVASVFRLYLDSGLAGSVCFALIMFLLASFQFVLLSLFYSVLSRSALATWSLSLPVAWTLSELLFPKFIPWFHGSTLFALTPLIQVADLGGPPLLSFLLFWSCALTTALITTRRSDVVAASRRVCLLLLALISATVLIYGKIRLHAMEEATRVAAKFNVVMVQPNLDPRVDFTAERLAARALRLQELTESALRTVGPKPDLVIWPESAVGATFYPEDVTLAPDDLRRPIRQLNVPLLFGGQVQLGKVYTPESEFFNSGLLLLPQGRLRPAYYKELLFPFAERIPLGVMFPGLGRLLKPVSNYRAGTDAETAAVKLGDVTIAVRICFEDIWPSLFRKNTARDGAQLLVSLSNDGWFAETAAMYQHHLLALWRAVENRRYLIRVGNNGISEIVDSSGRIIETLPPGEPAASSVIEVRLLDESTIFSRYGTLGTWLIISASSAACWLSNAFRLGGRYRL